VRTVGVIRVYFLFNIKSEKCVRTEYVGCGGLAHSTGTKRFRVSE